MRPPRRFEFSARVVCESSCRFVRSMFGVCLFVGALAACRAAPIVNLRLSPSHSQLPEVAKEIASLDGGRVAAEALGLRRLDAAYAAAVKDAEVRIHSAAAGVHAAVEVVPGAFLDAGAKRVGARTGFLLHVLPARPVSNAVLKKISSMERVRGAEEQALIDQGVREFGLLVDLVVAQLQSSSGTRGASFLAQHGTDAPAVDVRVLPPTEPFATVAGLVAEMQGRRDAAEDELRRHIAELEVKLLQRMRGMLAAALR